jgi:hypothetical protein
VKWEIAFHDDFEAEFDALDEAVQDELLAHAKLLEQFGPQLGRPRVDTLNGSRHANMKELRFDANDGVWHSLSTQGAKPSCWWQVTSREGVKSGFIGN